MRLTNFEVIFYKTEDGKCPAEDFIESQPRKMKTKIYQTLEQLKEKGNMLKEPHSKHLKDSIFEIRVKVNKDISRVLYFFFVDKRIVMTNGFVKKTQKTPPKEIELAKKYRKDYLLRSEESK